MQFNYYLSWGPIFILPSQFFNFIGFGCVASLRFSNLILSIFTAFMFLKIFLFLESKCFFAMKNRIHYLLLILYLFWPSRFLWTSAGIRESCIEFLIVSSTYFFLKIVLTVERKTSITNFISLLSSLSLLNFTRSLLFFGVLVINIFFIIFTKNLRKLIVVSIGCLIILLFNLLIPTVLLKSYSAFYEKRISNEIIQISKIIKEIQNEGINTPPESDQSRTQSSKISDKKIRLEKEVAKLENQLVSNQTYIRYLPLRTNPIPDPENSRFAKKIDARSQIPVKACKVSASFFERYFTCNLLHLPVGLYSVVLRPNPVQDWYSTPTKIASLENIFFVSLLLFLFCWIFLRGGFAFFRSLSLYPFLFLTTSLVGLALYEGNVGTAYRHRSIVIWALILTLNMLIYKEKISNPSSKTVAR